MVLTEVVEYILMTNLKKLHCGVVGVGRMGSHHARVYSQMDNVDFVGVVDQDETRRNDIVEEWGGKAFSTVEELISSGVAWFQISSRSPVVGIRRTMLGA